MGGLTRLFGEYPRVKVLEAILDLSPYQFSAVDVARQAGLYKPSAYNHMRKLEVDGLVLRVSERRPIEYRVNAELAELRALEQIRSSLDLIRRAQADRTGVEEIIRGLGRSLRAAVEVALLEPRTVATPIDEGEAPSRFLRPIAESRPKITHEVATTAG